MTKGAEEGRQVHLRAYHGCRAARRWQFVDLVKLGSAEIHGKSEAINTLTEFQLAKRIFRAVATKRLVLFLDIYRSIVLFKELDHEKAQLREAESDYSDERDENPPTNDV